MSYEFRSIVSRGAFKGEVMEAVKDADGNYMLFDPAKRRNGSVHSIDLTLTRSATEARRLIAEHGFSMRMRPMGARSVAPSMISAKKIVISGV